MAAGAAAGRGAWDAGGAGGSPVEPDGWQWGQVHIQLGREHGMTLRSGTRCRTSGDLDVACEHGHGAFLADGEQRDVCVGAVADK